MDDVHVSQDDPMSAQVSLMDSLLSYGNIPDRDIDRDERNESDTAWSGDLQSQIPVQFEVHIPSRPAGTAAQLLFTTHRRYELWSINSDEEPPSYTGVGPHGPTFRSDYYTLHMPRPADGRLERRFDPTVEPQFLQYPYFHYPFIVKPPRGPGQVIPCYWQPFSGNLLGFHRQRVLVNPSFIEDLRKVAMTSYTDATNNWNTCPRILPDNACQPDTAFDRIWPHVKWVDQLNQVNRLLDSLQGISLYWDAIDAVRTIQRWIIEILAFSEYTLALGGAASPSALSAPDPISPADNSYMGTWINLAPAHIVYFYTLHRVPLWVIHAFQLNSREFSDYYTHPPRETFRRPFGPASLDHQFASHNVDDKFAKEKMNMSSNIAPDIFAQLLILLFLGDPPTRRIFEPITNIRSLSNLQNQLKSQRYVNAINSVYSHAKIIPPRVPKPWNGKWTQYHLSLWTEKIKGPNEWADRYRELSANEGGIWAWCLLPANAAKRRDILEDSYHCWWDHEHGRQLHIDNCDPEGFEYPFGIRWNPAGILGRAVLANAPFLGANEHREARALLFREKPVRWVYYFSRWHRSYIGCRTDHGITETITRHEDSSDDEDHWDITGSDGRNVPTGVTDSSIRPSKRPEDVSFSDIEDAQFRGGSRRPPAPPPPPRRDIHVSRMSGIPRRPDSPPRRPRGPQGFPHRPQPSYRPQQPPANSYRPPQHPRPREDRQWRSSPPHPPSQPLPLPQQPVETRRPPLPSHQPAVEPSRPPPPPQQSAETRRPFVVNRNRQPPPEPEVNTEDQGWGSGTWGSQEAASSWDDDTNPWEKPGAESTLSKWGFSDEPAPPVPEQESSSAQGSSQPPAQTTPSVTTQSTVHAVPSASTQSPVSSSPPASTPSLAARLGSTVVREEATTAADAAPGARPHRRMRDTVEDLRRLQARPRSDFSNDGRYDLVRALNARPLESDWAVVWGGSFTSQMDENYLVLRDTASRMAAIGAREYHLTRHHVRIDAPMIPLPNHLLGHGLPGMESGAFLIHIPRGTTSIEALTWMEWARVNRIYWSRLRNDIALRLFNVIDETPPGPSQRVVDQPQQTRAAPTSLAQRFSEPGPPSLAERLGMTSTTTEAASNSANSRSLTDRLRMTTPSSHASPPLPRQSTPHALDLAPKPPTTRRGRRAGNQMKKRNALVDERNEEVKNTISQIMQDEDVDMREKEDGDGNNGDNDGEKEDGQSEDENMEQ